MADTHSDASLQLEQDIKDALERFTTNTPFLVPITGEVNMESLEHGLEIAKRQQYNHILFQYALIGHELNKGRATPTITKKEVKVAHFLSDLFPEDASPIWHFHHVSPEAIYRRAPQELAAISARIRQGFKNEKEEIIHEGIDLEGFMDDSSPIDWFEDWLAGSREFLEGLDE